MGCAAGAAAGPVCFPPVTGQPTAQHVQPASPGRPAVFFDRDGVINENQDGGYIQSWESFRFLPGAVESIAAIHRAGYAVVIVTNQAGIGRGYMTATTLEQIHTRMIAAIRAGGGQVDAVLYCPHLPESGCACRKPQPGMLRQAASRLGLDLQRSVLIGDHLTDLQAGLAAGCRTILVLTGRGHASSETVRRDPRFAGAAVVANLPAAVGLILK
jgi:D-glycero-D-manno-heptose 1,7-bisphosphate phosphatase